MFKVIQENEKIPDPLEKVPISKNDGTLRWFMNLSDCSDNETVDEDLAKIPKYQPDKDSNISIVQDGEYKAVPIEIMEQLLGVNSLSEDEEEQQRVIQFIKKQTSFGEEFKQKYKGFPEEFYKAIDDANQSGYRHHIDSSGNYSLQKLSELSI